MSSCHRHAWWSRYVCVVYGSVYVLCGVWLAISLAQVPTHITPDTSLGTTVTSQGRVHTIAGGTARGTNLFHSFDRFDVGTGDTARFTGPNAIANILSRVTGGQQSLIDGRLQSGIPGANLYLLNPSGVLFGPNASLDVSGSFHVSTADYLRLTDGARFNAIPEPQDQLLTTAPVQAFGFWSENPAQITVQESVLAVPEGQTISIVGGDIAITGGELGFLAAPSGQVNLVSVASPGEVARNALAEPSILNVGSFERLGEITLSDSALIDASGDPGGMVVIRGGSLLVDGSFIFADTLGANDGAPLGIDLQVAGNVTLTNGTLVTTDVFGGGDAGAIRVRADRIEMSNRAILGSRALDNSSSGDTGNIDITAGQLELTEAQIDSSTGVVDADGNLVAGRGAGGNITITAGAMVIMGEDTTGPFLSGIFSTTLGVGQAGDLTITTGQLEMTGGRITSATLADGAAGTITLEAGHIHLGREAQIFSSSGGLLTTGNISIGRGAGGDITIRADAIVISEEAETGPFRSGIFSNTQGVGPAGDLTITTGQLEMTGGRITSATLADGAAGTITLEAGHIHLGQEAQIFSSSGAIDITGNMRVGRGAGGDITITADAMVIMGEDTTGPFRSGIFSNTQGVGPAGDLTITTGRLEMTGGRIASDTIADGAAGAITVAAGRLTLTEGAQISSSTFGPGRGGSVTVTAEDILLTGSSSGGSPSGFFSDSGTREVRDAGPAGGIVVTAGTLTLRDGGEISSSTFGMGQGGSVTVTATEALTLRGTTPDGQSTSGIFANAQGETAGAGNAGTVRVTAPQISATEGARISSSTFGPGQGGSVTVTATEALTLRGRGTRPDGRPFSSGIFANAEGREVGAGQAGTVWVEAPQLSATAGAQISSSTFGPGRGGSVTVTATEALTLEGADIFANAQGKTTDAGAAGAITVAAGHLTLTEGAQISSSTFGPGRGGSVTVTAMEALTLRGTTPDGQFRSGIFASAQGEAVGAGQAGTVRVEAPQLSATAGAVISSGTLGPGHGGSVMVAAGRLTLTEGAQINSITMGPGRGGSVTVTATEAITLRGTSSGIFASAQGEAGGAGQAGTVQVEAPQLSATAGAQISSSTFGPGRGGSVTVTATEAITLRGTSSGIFASAEGRAAGAGQAGTVQVEAPQISATEGARISSSTFGPGRGGSVLVTATDVISIASRGGVRTSTAGTGRGGDLTLQAQRVHLSDRASIAAESTGTGNAGSIRLTTTDTFLSDNSVVTTAAETAGGGNIELEGRLVRLTNSAITAEAQGVEQQGSDGGNVTIHADFVILDKSQVQANAFGGNGGRITIAAEDAFLADTQTCADQECLNASSQLGVAGTVEVSTPTADLSGVVTPLPQTFTQATALLPQRCAERLQGQPVSTFVLAGRDSVPVQPGGVLPSPLVAEGSERAQRGPDKARGNGVPGVRRGQLGVDVHGRPRVQGWPVRGMASLAWDAACP